ncbi:MAG: TonB-dependent receptor [Sphingopyxis sp.]|nr:TonB-dependent receptor [Sphingopyxis sp.]
MIRRTGSALIALALADPAPAQRTDENAVREAEDGFGRSVGNESVGIYASGEVCGFSANDAGNARVEGLYFDRAGGITDVIVRGSTVRLGLTAFGYPFPAPTGIVDTELRRTGADAVLSLRLSSGEYLGPDLVAETAIPVSEKFGLNLGFGLFDDQYVSGASARFVSYGGVARWRPADSVELAGFFARYDYGDEEQSPTLYTGGSFLPPKVERRLFYGQQLAEWRGHSQNFGGIAKASLGGWGLAAGLFNSRFTRDDYASLYFDRIDRDGRGQLVVVSGEDQLSASTSGEVRVSRVFAAGATRHRLIVSARGRRKQSDYGGYDVVDLGPAMIGVPDPRPEPDRDYSELTEDRVRQTSLAIGYETCWPGVGELNLGLTRTDYRKAVAQPGRPLERRRGKPWLWNAALAVTPTDRLTLYGATTRGLEESGTAPGNAANRNEALPALRTRQQEIGLRYAFPGGIRLLSALFDIRKPYFEIDSHDGIYRIFGTVIHRGAEFSLSGAPLPGLDVVAGAVLLQPRVTGQAVDEGRLGTRPIGRTGLLIDLSADYRLPGLPQASVDLRFLHEGRRTARADNSLDIPARTTIDIGARYRATIGNAPATLRLQIRNIANVFGWRVFGGGGFAPVQGRRVLASLTADF